MSIFIHYFLFTACCDVFLFPPPLSLLFSTVTVIEFNSPLTIAPCNKQLNPLFPSSIIIKKKTYFQLLVQSTGPFKYGRELFCRAKWLKNNEFSFVFEVNVCRFSPRARALFKSVRWRILLKVSAVAISMTLFVDAVHRIFPNTLSAMPWSISMFL